MNYSLPSEPTVENWVSVGLGRANFEGGGDGGVEREGLVEVAFGALCEELGSRVRIVERSRKGRGFIFVGHFGGFLWSRGEFVEVEREAELN